MAKLSSEGRKRRQAGSRRGAETIKASFAQAITRDRYCELVGIHRTTLRRWEKEGVIQPTLVPIRNIPTHTFTPGDVAIGQRIAALLREGPAGLSLVQAADRARKEGGA